MRVELVCKMVFSVMDFSNRVFLIGRRKKIAILAICDFVLSVISVYFAFSMTGEKVEYWLLLTIGIIAGFISIATGSSRIVLRAFDIVDVPKTALFSALVGVVLFALGRFMPEKIGISTALMTSFALLCLSALVRVFGARLLGWVRQHGPGRERVIIYGAGASGQQLKAMLRSADEFTPVAFVDDNPSLHNATVGGLKVRKPAQIGELINRTGASHVLLAIPSLSPEQRAEVLAKLRDVPAKVLTLPSYLDLLRGKDMVSSLRTVDPSELLGREAVSIDLPEIRTRYCGKSVFISGAGGSIGSELCRQVMETAPSRLVLFELNEFALYSIHMELLQHRHTPHVQIVPILGSVCDRVHAQRVMQENETDIVLHAAAYKHVPLVEDNPLQAAHNNVLGTQSLALAAQEAGVQQFILVSTDKAVRPTNVMGATKRLAELVIQDIQTRSENTIYSMVRFGNVLGSSGSVIPLFNRQIREGGPITVTHPEVTRYFMTIPEAARLVLLAGSFAQGGEVFVLDMGKPVKIADLARRLIEISGLSVRDEENPDGDIAINFVGLRPGEKLYEELLVDDNTISTPHPKIMRAIEGSRSELEIVSALRKIQTGLQTGDHSVVRPMLMTMVDGYDSKKLSKRKVLTILNEGIA